MGEYFYKISFKTYNFCNFKLKRKKHDTVHVLFFFDKENIILIIQANFCSFISIFMTETISGTDDGSQPRPKYIFNEMLTNIYMFYSTPNFKCKSFVSYKTLWKNSYYVLVIYSIHVFSIVWYIMKMINVCNYLPLLTIDLIESVFFSTELTQ